MKKAYGEQINKEMAAQLETIINQNKAKTAELSNFKADNPTAIAGAVQSLANTKPAETEKIIKALPALMVEYAGKPYGDKKEISMVNNSNQLKIKNLEETEGYSWKLSDGTTGSSNTLNISFPTDKPTLTLEVSQGNRKMSVVVRNKTFTYTQLSAIDKNSPNRVAIANDKKSETLYIVRPPKGLTNRTVDYKMLTNIKKGEFENLEPIWGTTLPKNGLYEGEVLNSNGSIEGETRHYSDAIGKTYATAIGKTYSVNVEVVSQKRHAVDFMPPGVSHLLTSTYEKTEQGFKQVQRVLEPLGVTKFEVKPLKIKGEKYNKEDDGSRHFLEVTDGNINGGFEINLFEKTIYPPFLKPLNITGVSTCGLYGKASIDLPITGGIEQERIHETQKLLINKPFYISGAAKGCLEAGLKFELLVAKSAVEATVKGFGKGCIGGAIKYKNGDENPFSVNVSIDPVVVGINAVIKKKVILSFLWWIGLMSML